MNEKLASAVEALQEELQAKTQEIVETKKMINGLRRRMGQEPLYTDVELAEVGGGTVKPDAYYGVPLSTAARLFLERRKSAVTVEEVMRGLEAGGFDFKALQWKESDRLRLLAVTLGKNSQTFHRLPNGTVGLLAWYPTVVQRKEKGDRDAERDAEREAEKERVEKENTETSK